MAVTGTVSSSAITLTDSQGDTYTGSFTSDTMHFKVTSPPGNPGSVGAQCVEYCGYTQTISLTRQSP
jgi:hypothetical protein